MKPFRLIDLLGAAMLFALVALALATTATRGGDPERMGQAEALYAQGMELAANDAAGASAKFRESAELLAVELRQVDSAAMHFNRANALLQAGDLGEAIAEYRSAELRSPADPRIATNLAEARGKVPRSLGTPAPTPLEQACALWAALGERTRLVGVVLLGCAAILAIRLQARVAGIVCAVLGIVVALTVAADIARRSSAHLAVIVEPTTLRKGNGDGFEQVIAEALPAGTECRVHEERPGWLEVELSGGTRGWIRDGAATRAE